MVLLNDNFHCVSLIIKFTFSYVNGPHVFFLLPILTSTRFD